MVFPLPKVLIVIKSDMLRQRLSDALTEYDLHICHTGKEALAKMERLHPDILLLDLQLTDMPGFTLLEKASFQPRIILTFTNYVDNDVLTQAAKLGIQSVTLLPCSVRYVQAQLDRLIEKALFAES